MKNIEVLLYIPNMLNYLRLLLVILMIFNMKKRPILTFTLCVSSGLIDSVDGRIARYLEQTSNLGAVLDLTMDRATNLAQYFTLGVLYEKYSSIFFLIAVNEILKDFLELKLKILLLWKIAQNAHLEDSKLEASNIINNRLVNIPFSPNDTSSLDFYYGFYVQPFFWYTSDLFYWLIYFNAFLKVNSSLNALNSINKNKYNKYNFILRLIHFIKSFLNEFQTTTESLSLFCEEHILVKFNIKCFKSNQIRFIFNMLMNVCLVGGFMKFYFNAKDAYLLLNEYLNNL